MISAPLKPLLGRLDRTCTRALEAAVGACVGRGHHEVTVEHLLLRLFDDPSGDIAFVFSHFDVEPERVRRSLQATIDDLPGGHAGKPVFSPLILELVQDAWMIASIDEGLAYIRTGSILAAVVARPGRYLVADHPELGKIHPEELRRRFRAIVSGSSEDQASAAPAAGGAGAAPAAVGASALARFATDFTASARAGRIDPVFGRDREIRQTIDILGRRRKNNPIIVGEAGVGKTAIVEGLALRIAEDDVPDLLRGVSIWALDLGLLQAGAGVKGEFESRLKSVIDEVKAAAARVILFIDEAHMLIGAGSAPGGADAANLLKPALARGELRTIAATTWAEYKQYFEEDAALARRFQPVKIDEPGVDDAALMLRGLKAKYEAAHGVTVRDDAVDAAVRLSARYITGRLLPDKAVDLLDTAAARVKIGQSAKPPPVEALERRIGGLTREEEALARDQRGGIAVDPERLSATLASLAAARTELAAAIPRWKEQKAAVDRVLSLRGEKAGEDAVKAALADLARAHERGGTLVRLEVDPDIVAQVVEDWTGVPVGRMVEDEAARVQGLEARLAERIKGQDHAVSVVSEALRAAKLGLKDPKKPQVFLLVGPSGVGKTELGLAVADALFGGERFVVTINMSEYQDREMGVSGLVGAKPGYVGYGKGGALTEAVRQRPYSVVLLDEVEKACVEVRNLFYQVFDKGELTDGTGRRIDFKNTVVFMTTNLGAPIIQEMCGGIARPTSSSVLAAIQPLLRRVLSPAWLSRTTVVPFYSLPRGAIAEIAKLKLAALGRRLSDSQKVELSVAPEVVEAIAERCTDVETGARNIDFILEGSVLPRISSELLGNLAEGSNGKRISVGVEASGGFVVRFGG